MTLACLLIRARPCSCQPRQPSVQAAFETAYLNTDRGYLAENGSDPMALFAGTCAVAAYVDLARSTVCVSNLGDSRAVIGSYDSGTLQTVHMSEDHTACYAGSRLKRFRQSGYS